MKKAILQLLVVFGLISTFSPEFSFGCAAASVTSSKYSITVGSEMAPLPSRDTLHSEAHAAQVDDAKNQSQPALVSVKASAPEASSKEASQPSPHKLYGELRQKVSDISEVGHYVDHLLSDSSNAIAAKNIVVIFDIDGTLTNYSQPSKFTGDGPFPGRKNAVELVKKLKKQGIKVIAASANTSFEKILGKIKDLGLEEEFEIKKTKKLALKNNFFAKKVGGSKEPFFFYRNGNAVTIGSRFGRSNINKAFAPKIVLNQIEFADLKQLIFVDDRMDYILTFDGDVKDFSLFSPDKTKVTYFNLTYVPEYVGATDTSTGDSKSPFDPRMIPSPVYSEVRGRVYRSSAGAIAYTQFSNGVSYVLFGKERFHKSTPKDQQYRFNFMRGAVDPAENYLETAAREFCEESAGIYCSSDSEHLLQYPFDIYHTPDPERPTQAVTFYVHVGYVPAQAFLESAKSSSNRHYQEMSEYRWVQVNDLKKALENDKNLPFLGTTPEGEKVEIHLLDYSFSILKQGLEHKMLEHL